MHAADPVAVRPLLIDALANTTLIDRDRSDHDRGTANVSSFAAGLLFHRRREALPSLLDALAERRGNDNSAIISLFIELGQRDAYDICARLAERLSCSQSDQLVRNASLILSNIIRNRLLSGPLLADVTQLLRRILPEAEPSVALEVATALRTADRADPTVWDWLAEAARNGTLKSGYVLGPIPDGRLTAACDVARCNVSVGLQMIENHDGPADEQLMLAALAGELLDAGREKPTSFGYLTEQKLYRLRDDSRCGPWITLARHILREQDGPARRYIIHALFHRNSLNNADLRELARTELRGNLTTDERSLIAKSLYRGRNQHDVVDLFDMLRSSRMSASKDVVDRALIEAAGEDEHEISTKLFEFWQSLPPEEQSALSVAAVKAIHEGLGPDQIGKREFLRHLGEEAV